MKVLLRRSLGTIAALVLGYAQAATYPLPPPDQSVIGEIQRTQTRYEETLLDLGRRYSVGYEEMVAANPGVDPWLPGEGTQILIPQKFVLPDVPREGIVVNLPEHRLYYFPKPAAGAPPIVVTYPVSIGKMDWKTPLGLTNVVAKVARPSWYPPESVRKEHEADGNPLPKVVPPGPDNPLGEYAMRLGIPGGSYLIHGTNRPAAVGMEVTHGCIRMYPEDIEQFFKMVPVGTKVRLLQQPYKMGWQGGTLYMEVHVPLDGPENPETASLTNITRLLVSATNKATTEDRAIAIDWTKAESMFRKPSGVPEPMSLNADPSPDAGGLSN